MAVKSSTHASVRSVGFMFLPLAAAVMLGLTAAARAQQPRGAATNDSLQILSSIQDVIARAIERNERSVVSIARIKKRENDTVVAPHDRMRALNGFGFGVREPVGPKDPDFIPNDFATGVVVDSKGLVLTNHHVLVEGSQYVIWAQRKAYDAKVRAADPRSDLAVLEIVETVRSGELAPIKFGDSEKVRKGHIVLTLGNPYAIAKDGEVCAGWGIVSNLRRKAPLVAGETKPQASKPTLHHYGTLIQTDAKLNLGTSGGALLNLQGEMIGLTTSLAAMTGYEQSAGYAIPVDDAFLRIVDTLKLGREVEYGLLGVFPEGLHPEEIRSGQRGVRIREIKRGTPAWRADIRKGDIVTAIDGRAVEDEDDLMLRIGRLPAEAKVRLEILRDGQKAVREVTLAKNQVVGNQVFTPEPAWRGMRVDYSSVRRDGPFGHTFGPEMYDGCVLVSEVAQDSLAWQSGLRPGMFITHVEDQHVKTPREFRSAVSEKGQTVKVRLGGTRPGEDAVREVKPGAG